MVSHCQDIDDLFSTPVDDRVREPLDDNSSEFTAEGRAGLWPPDVADRAGLSQMQGSQQVRTFSQLAGRGFESIRPAKSTGQAALAARGRLA